MSAKAKTGKRNGSKRRGKPDAQPASLAESGDTTNKAEQTPEPLPDKPESVLSVADGSHDTVSDSPESPLPAPDAAQALSALSEAEAANLSQPDANAGPSLTGTAPDAEVQLEAAVAENAGVASQTPVRKGGWPKGKPRKPRSPSSDFPARTPGASGAAASSLTEAQLRGRVVELEARLNERARAGMAIGLTQLAKVGFGFAARRKGTHWYLTDEEAREIGEAFATAAEPYMGYIAPAVPFLVAAGSLYGAVALRLEVETEIEQGKRQRILPGESNA